MRPSSILILSDDIHGAYDWIWMHHPVDTTGPEVSLRPSDGWARLGENMVTGTAEDPSGVASVTLETKVVPGGATTTIVCPQADARSGEWACAWNAGTLVGADAVELRARGTDTLGNVGAWSPAMTLRVDRIPPTVILDANLEAALAGGVVNPNALTYAGGVEDDVLARRVELHIRRGGIANRLPLAVTPGDAASGVWSTARTLAAVDGLTETLTVYAYDGAGNRSDAMTRSYRVDTAAPASPARSTRIYLNPDDAALQAATGLLVAYQPGAPCSQAPSPTSLVERMRVRVTAPGGGVTWDSVAVEAERGPGRLISRPAGTIRSTWKRRMPPETRR